MTDTKELPAWPKYGDKGYTKYDPCGSLGDEVFDSEKFERAKTAYWEARCRLALEALKTSSSAIGCTCACRHCVAALEVVYSALNSIGDIPEGA